MAMRKTCFVHRFFARVLVFSFIIDPVAMSPVRAASRQSQGFAAPSPTLASWRSGGFNPRSLPVGAQATAARRSLAVAPAGAAVPKAAAKLALLPGSTSLFQPTELAGAGESGGTTSVSGSISMGPQAMEGDLKLSPGAILKAGYDFTIPGTHPEDTVQFTSAKLTFQPLCVSGGSSAGTLVVPLADTRITVPQNSTAWYPSGNQQDPSVYQGSISMPDLCGGGQITLKKGGRFTAILQASDTSHSVNVRWHYSANGSSGSWSGTKTFTPATLTSNMAPVVNAGPDQAIDFPPGTASLHGTATDDGLPIGALAISWSKVSGPGNVTFTPADAGETTAIFTAAGTYVLRLTADDSKLSASDDVTVIVSSANAPPQVSAGPDQDITLPVQTVTLAGEASDDGRPVGATLTTTWTVVSPLGAPVVFGNAHAVATSATFPGAGEYVLRLTADDTQLQVSDDMKVSVHSDVPPVVAVQDASALEAQEGTTGAMLIVTLSKPSSAPVTVDYRTADGTATAGCDYLPRFGTVRFEPGETSATIDVPVVGELIPEADETVLVQLGNANGATLGQTQATLTIVNDDVANAAPSFPFNRTPPDRSTGITLPPVLSWLATDADPGDALTHDVHLGTAFDTSTQSWTTACPSTQGPGARQAAVSGYDESTDRLMVFGGSATADDAVWVLANASATGGVPEWTPLASTGGPTGLMRAAAAYDASGNRLIVYGGCTGDCTSGSDETWILANANGVGGTPAWSRISVAGPGPLLDHAAAFDPVARRFIVFGGSSGPNDAPVNDVWVLKNLEGQPSWQRLQPSGDGPAARAGMSASYDPEGNVLVVFGGRAGTLSFKDVWILRHANGTGGVPAWSRVQPAGTAPASRWGHVAAYDPVSDRLVVFGGSTAAANASQRFVFSDLSMLTNVTGASSQWIALTPGGGPTGRVQPAAAYAAGANRLLVVGGGTKTTGPSDDVWVLANAIGSLPLVAGDQAAVTYTADGLVPSAPYFWRVVARDSHGAWRGSPAWRFTSNRAPLVDAGPDQAILSPTTMLAGTATDDGLPVGALTLEWSAVSGPAPVHFDDSTSRTATASFVAVGTYILRLTASDGQLVASDDVTITFDSGNQPPAVSAGPDLTITLPASTATLSGTVVDDGLPAGGALTASWTLLSGPSPVTFGDPTSVATTVSFTSAGQYFLRLTASDGELSSADDLAVIVNAASIGPNQPPVVSAGAARTVTMPTNVVVLLGSVSDDGLPSGTLSSQWTTLSGPGAVAFDDPSLSRTTATFSTPGTYVLRLTASDGVLSATGTTTVTVNPASVVSYVDTAFKYTIVGQGALSGFEKVDFDDSTFLIGNAGFGTVGFCPLDNPPFLNTLWSEWSDILLRKHFTVPAEGATNLKVGVAIDNDVQVFVNGVDVSGGMNVHEGCPTRDSFVFDVPSTVLVPGGDNLLAVRGRDRGGLTYVDVRLGGDIVPGVDPGNEAPVADAGPDQTITFPTSTVTLSGSVSDDGYPVGSLTAFWNKVSGPGNVTFGGLSSDAGKDFSATANPSGAWSYGFKTTPDGALAPFGANGTYNGLPAWFSAANTRPVVAFNPNSGTVTFGGVSLPSRSLDLVPGTGGELSAVRWTAPRAGMYVIRAAFQGISDVPADVTIASTALGTLFASGLRYLGDAAVFYRVLAMSEGDAMDFVAGFRASDAFASQNVGLVVAIEEIGAATATFSAPGTYLLRLTASDTQRSGSDDVVVTVAAGNQPPMVDAGPDQVAVFPADAVTVPGSATDDGLPVGGGLSIAWSKVSGPGAVTFVSPTSPATTASFGAAGTYVLRLTASDSVLDSSDDVEVVVTAATNQPPVVSAGPDRALSYPTTSLTLQGTVTDDGLPVGGTITVLWTKVSGPGAVAFGNAMAPTTTATFGATGPYTLRLTASDSSLQGSADVHVDVYAENQPPTVSAGPAQTIALPTTNTAILNGVVTDDGAPVGGTLSVLWSTVIGPAAVTFGTPASPTSSATFVAAGTYVLRLTASDSVLSASSEVTITVTTGNRPPTVSAGPDQVLTLPVNGSTLAGTAIDDGLPEGSTLAVNWSVVSAPGVVSFGTPKALETGVTLSDPGLYVFRLTATDGVLVGSDDVQVSVSSAPAVGAPPVVALAAPAEGARLTAPTTVIGSAQSDTLASWKLEYRLEGETDYTRFADGTSAVNSATLGTFDPTLLLNGLYEVRLTATDTAGRSVRTSTKVVVRDNQKVGPFSLSFVDLEVPVAGLPIRVTRTYDSRDKGKGDFGVGWRLDLSNVRLAEKEVAGLAWAGVVIPGFFPSYCLQAMTNQVVTVTLPDGKVLEFEPVISPSCQTFVPIETATVSFQPLPGTHASLAPAGDGYVFVEGSWPGPMQLYDGNTYDIYDPDDYVLTMPDGRQFSINQVRGLTQIKDLSGNILTVSSAGITHSSGRGIAFTRDTGDRITAITDPEGHSMSYGYDVNGDLASFTDREQNRTSFTYDAEHPHLLSTIVDPRGKQPIRNEYYGDGRIKSHTDAFHKTISYSYEVVGRQEYVTDRDGGLRILEYDERGNVVRETDPEGKVIDRTFDARNNRTSETVSHDQDAVNPPKTTYVYDAQDDLRSVTDPESHTIEYTYNARKQVTLTKDPRGTYTVNDYDGQGRLLSSRVSVSPTGTPALSEWDYTYRADGSIATQTVVIDGVPSVTAYEYDGFGNLTKETDALGHATSYTYDGNGNRLTQTTTRTSHGATETLTTTYTYDHLDHLVQTTEPDGTSTRTVYDEVGKQKETYDKLDHLTAYDYDDMGRLVRTTYPDLTTEESTYDGEGHRLTSKDRAGRVTSYTYDHLGRRLRTTYLDTTFTENTYDSAGRLVATKDGRGKTTTYAYDNAGRRTSVKVPLGGGAFAETIFTYDANGNEKTVRDPNLHTTTYEYDEQNRRTKTIFPDATFTQTTYDSLGRRTSERDQAGKLTQFRYDVLGRLVKVIDALSHETTYAYDELGNRVGQTDANTHTTAFEYDKLGRETKRILPGGEFETKTYDAAGNLKTRTDFNVKTTTYAYDVNNRLTSRNYDAPAQASVSFTYTPTGRRETATVGTTTTSYGYDLRDRLAGLTYADGRKLEYAYDGNGNRTSLKATIGATVLTTAYTYDDANRLDLVTDPLGRTYDHGYDAGGNRTSLSYPNGTATAYTYDSLNRLTNLGTTNPSTGVTVQSYALTLGPSGNRTKITDGDGTVHDYTYDDLYRLNSEKVTVGALTQYQKDFTYDSVGNRKTQVTNGSGASGTPTAPGSITYGYDDRDRLLAEALGASPPTGYAYDANGNLVTKDNDATYTWDLENRLVKVTKANGTIVENLYDADGVRLQTKTTPSGQPAQTTNHLVDTAGLLSQVVAETDALGALKAYYVRGDELLAVMRPLVPTPVTAADWQTRFFHADGIGSIRRLTNDAGQITDGYSYTAFGELLAHTGSDAQPYAFAGEHYDPNVGFQYHRARWMDPREGLFFAMDSASPDPEEPVTAHRYLYAADDPANQVDPSGLFFDAASALSALTVMSTLNSIASMNPAAVPVSARDYIKMPSAQQQLLVAGLKDIISLVPSGKIQKKIIAPLTKALGFSFPDFQNYLSEGAGFYDGTASQAKVIDAVYPFYAGRAFLSAEKLPVTSSVADLFKASVGLNAITSFTSPTFVTFMRPSAVGTARHARALVLHEALHGYGSALDASNYDDDSLKKAFGLSCGSSTGCITQHIESNY